MLALELALAFVAWHVGAAPVHQGGAASGTAADGRALVESQKCLECHRIGETGSRLGPDLSDIGRVRSAEQIRRAIVAPNAEVLPEYRQVRIVTKDGSSVTGRLLNQDAFSIQLIDADGRLATYVKSSLREHALIVRNPMPSYDGKLTAQQMADVVGYLGSLKGADR